MRSSSSTSPAGDRWPEIATYERPAVVHTETNGYSQRLRIDDQELWVMSHLTKRVLQHASTWRGQG